MRFAARASRSEGGRSETEGSLNQLARASLVVGGTLAAASILRGVLKARTRYLPWERSPYGGLPHQVLIVGGGFAGYMAPQVRCVLGCN
jgi:hypothetical protein